jgi:transaldolase
MTRIFLDTANLEEIQEMSGWGIIQGLTTNQKIFEKEKGCNFERQAKTIIQMLYPFPVSIEGPNDLGDLLDLAMMYNSWGNFETTTFSNVVIKVPMMGNGDGLKAIKTLNKLGIATNATACITLNQTFLAAQAGATYVSLFFNRMVDYQKELGNKEDFARRYALDTIKKTMEMLERENLDTQLIVGSIRHPRDIEDILSVSPDIITIPTKILKEMPHNSMTEKTLKEFDKAWENFCKAEQEAMEKESEEAEKEK